MTIHRLFIFIGILIICTACTSKEKAGEIASTSPNEKNQVIISGEKNSYFSPLSVSIRVQTQTRQDSLWVEIEQTEINKKTCLVDWLNNNECIVTLYHRDMDRHTIHLQIVPKGIIIKQQQSS